MRISSRLAIFVADRHLAHTALVERGAGLANRLVLASARLLGESKNTIAHASYGFVWRLLYCNIIAETLHPSRVRLFAPARSWVRRVLSEKLQEDSAAGAIVVETFHYAIFCLIVLMCFGERLDEPAVRAIATAQWDPLIYMSRKMAVFSFLQSIKKHLFRNRLQNVQAMQRRKMELSMPLIDASQSTAR
jgi:hypothetical protein